MRQHSCEVSEVNVLEKKTEHTGYMNYIIVFYIAYKEAAPTRGRRGRCHRENNRNKGDILYFMISYIYYRGSTHARPERSVS